MMKAEHPHPASRILVLLLISGLLVLAAVLVLRKCIRQGEALEGIYLEDQGEPFEPAMLAHKDRVAVAELLIREMLRYHNKDRDGVCFIALGRQPEAGQYGPWDSLGAGAVQRFKGYGFSIKDVSAMVYADGSVRDKDTGGYGCVYYVDFIRRLGPNSFLVDAIAERGGLAAVGFSYRVMLSNGKWTVERAGGGWNS